MNDMKVTLTYRGRSVVVDANTLANAKSVLMGGLSEGAVGKPVSLCYCSDCKECGCQGVLFPQCECTCKVGGCGPCDGLQAAQ